MKRLMSLDVLRGITVCSMILVNNAGSKYSYTQLKHSEWNGLTVCDLVFPFFLFMVGISTYISLKKFNFLPSQDVVKKIFRRMCIIILIGISIGWFEHICEGEFLPINTIRVPGVLQRIGLCYGIVSFLVICVSHKNIPWIALGLLVIYSTMLFIGNGYVCDETNIIVKVDRFVFGEDHLYKKDFVDPEGLLGCIPSVAHTLIGFMFGGFLLDKIPNRKKIAYMIVGAMIMIVVGGILSLWIPVNKRVWSSTYVLVTCGLATLLLILLIYIIDVKGIKKVWTFFLVFGVNPLFLYVLSEIVAILVSCTNIKSVFYLYLSEIFTNEYMLSFIYSIIFCFVIGVVGYILYKKKIYIKI